MTDAPWHRPRGPYARLPKKGQEVLARWHDPPREEVCVFQSLRDNVGPNNDEMTTGYIWTRVSDGHVFGNWPHEWKAL